MKGVLSLLILLFVLKNAFAQYRVESQSDTLLTDSDKYISKTISVFDNNFLSYQFINITGYYFNNHIKETYNKSLDGQMTGLYQSYYSNGNEKEIYSTFDGRRIGAYLSYYMNGDVKIIGEYQSFRCVDEDLYDKDTTLTIDQTGLRTLKIVSSVVSIKTGEWIYYNEQGNIIRKEFWNKGKLIN